MHPCENELSTATSRDDLTRGLANPCREVCVRQRDGLSAEQVLQTGVLYFSVPLTGLATKACSVLSDPSPKHVPTADSRLVYEMPGVPSAEQSVVAKIHYVKRTEDGEPLETFLYELPEGKTRPSNVDHEEFDTTIIDLRTVSEEFTLQRNGFKLSHLIVPDDINWEDEAEARPCSCIHRVAVHTLSRCCRVNQSQPLTS